MITLETNFIYNIFLKTEPEALVLDDKTNKRKITRLYFKDSLTKFFPYCELFMNDPAGEMVDKLYFFEGMKFKLKFGSDEVTDPTTKLKTGGYIEHDFFWSENQVHSTELTTHISGESVNILLSNYALNDFAYNRAFKKPISDIVKDVISSQLLFDSKIKQFITPTINDKDDVWYQGVRTTREFLEYLASRAYTNTNPIQSCFSTFLNLQNEFRFQSYYDLYNQKPTKQLSISFDEQRFLDSSSIRQLEIVNMGYPVNRNVENVTSHKLKSDGTFVEQNKKLSEIFLKSNQQDKILIKKDTYSNNTSILNFGIENTVSDLENFLSKNTEIIEDSNLIYQIIVTINFDKEYVSGRTLTIDVQKLGNTQLLQFFSGNWLIVSSEHLYSVDGTAYSKMNLSKSSIRIDSKYIGNSYL